MFANVELAVAFGQGLVVPANAVIDSGSRQVVFVSHREGYFEPREVKVGERLEHAVQIVDGLKEGDEVAAAANFFIDADSQLQAASTAARSTSRCWVAGT
jgi:Cu(I)/Ag(I) efflux system membrane fusion protein